MTDLVEVRARISDRDYYLLKKLSSSYHSSLSSFVRLSISDFLSKKGCYNERSFK